MYPTAIPVLIDLGRAYGMRYDYPASRRCFDEAMKAAKGHPRVATLIGIRCREFSNFEIAQSYLEKAVQNENPPGEALAHLAEIRERYHHHTEAAELAARARKIQPDNPLAALVEAKLAKNNGDLAQAEQILLSFLKTAGSDKEVIPKCWYELGSILDRVGRYDEAMKAFLQAKALLLPHASADQDKLKSLQHRLRIAESTILPDVLKRWAASAEQLKPFHRLAILSGHPRSGTTLLEQVLDSHDDAISADETRVLNDDVFSPFAARFSPKTLLVDILNAAQPTVLRQMRADYFKYTELFLGEKIGNRLLVEKNPGFSGWIPAVPRVFPEAKFLIAVRDPRDVCLSCFMQPLPLNPLSSAYLTMESTVTQYISAMSMWRVMLPRIQNPHLLVRYEDVLDDLEGQTRKVLEFLGLTWDARTLHFNEHAQKKLVRSPTYSEVAKPIYKTAKGRWHNYQKYIEPFLKKLETYVKAFGYE